MIVHDIEMHDVSAGIKDRINVFPQAGKVGGEDRWGDKSFSGTSRL